MPSPNGLPLQLTSFIGREREIAEVRKLLGSARLLTLTGAGGSGKTRLALHIAAKIADRFAHGVFFVNLAPITNPNLVVSTIAQALDVKEAPGTHLLDSLQSYLQGKHALVLLDNFEQVLEAAPSVAVLLGTAPDLKVLVTSREPLRLRGEQLYQVPTLELPDPKRQTSAQELSRYEAIALFIQRSQEVKSHFVLTEENAPIVAEICQRLDGLPLAIELAAARSGHLPPKALLERLGSRLKLLTGGARDAPARQQTLRNTIEWSYALLSEGEKQLFRRMAVFQGGCTLEALETVCNYDGQLQVDVLDGVESLDSKSLLQQRESREGEPRFWMLETIHESAREKLQESGELGALQKEHAPYFMRLAEEAEPHLTGANQQEWLNRLEDEHDNLRHVLKWTREHAEMGYSEAVEIGLRTGGAISRFWYVRGYLREGREHLEGLLSLAALLGCSPNSTAKALIGSGGLALRQGAYPAARIALEQAFSIAKEVGDKKSMASALSYLGGVSFDEGDYRACLSLHEQSLDIGRKIGDKWGVAHSVGNLGILSYTQRDFPAAHAFHEQSLALFRELGDKSGVAWSLNNLGLVSYIQGDYHAARTLLKQSLVIVREIGDSRSIAISLAGLGEVEMETGQPHKGARLLGASEALYQTVGAVMAFDDVISYDRAVASARTQLGEEAFEKARQEGWAMSMEQAIAYALEEIAESEPPATVATPLRYPNELTRREVEVLRLVAQSLTNAQIAQHLFLSPATVNAHLTSIYSKLNVTGRNAATRFAIEHNLA